ncbi:DNA-processing protein DprA [Paracoccus sp. SCSIO 75233]|uniref:DNA-processing protein DprA n=1 Tax=Paracoccus sp. SCSIO 75233 TaxID=3017782 RepID=UPI0022F0FFA2|nr:DNA-processing protein DprA [Paracoccus sp. SCSIO 75233]WBU53636.1 DNA-processing protein DprA [Paracoccus sp. SCSIO 75233]
MFSFNSPPTPSSAKEDDLLFLRLIRSRRVGPVTFHRLIAEHGSVASAFDALPDVAKKAGVKGYEPCPEKAATAELRAGHKAGARLIRCDSPDYPALLRSIAGAPPVLWVKGNAEALSKPAIALIGARNASSLGLRMARGLAGALGEAGYIIVSGLARGIDSAAHGASVKTGTVAVMAGGIDVIYPPENAALAAMICDRGCLISEQPPGMAPMARHFPMRNRIISGLSRGVVVVEAAAKSGSLITARDALDQGREVLAVPGHPVDGRAGGCNQLIRDGAMLIRNAEDILAALPLAEVQKAPDDMAQGIVAPERLPPDLAAQIAPARPELPLPPRTRPDTAGVARKILSRLSPSPIDEDMLIRDIGIPASTATAIISKLEIEGKLSRLAGGKLALSPSRT